MRKATVSRRTSETKIKVAINLDGSGRAGIDTGVGFLDHMLELLSKHSLLDLKVEAKGDTRVDDHHTVEDVGIALGAAIKEALGDKRDICRYGFFLLPMDDALVSVAIDFSGRAFLGWNVDFPAAKIGSFDSELVREFFQAFAAQAGANVHVERRSGVNGHHIAEAAFKALARSIRQAIELDPRTRGEVPSTKGTL